jgi:hypothetical protein
MLWCVVFLGGPLDPLSLAPYHMTTVPLPLETPSIVSRLNRVTPPLLALSVMMSAMLIPLAHIAIHGTDTLSANVVASYAARAGATPGLLTAARQVAETRLGLQPVLGPFHTLALLLAMTICGWALARWRTARPSLGTVLRAAVVGVAAAQVFYLTLYGIGWALLGTTHMMPEWQQVIPTSVSSLRLIDPRYRALTDALTLGGVVRFVAFGAALRHLDQTLPKHVEWVVAVGAALVTGVAFGCSVLL